MDLLETAVNHENESIHAEFVRVEFMTAPKLQRQITTTRWRKRAKITEHVTPFKETLFVFVSFFI